MIEVGKQYNNWLIKEILDDKNCLCECQCEKHTQRVVSIQSVEKGLSKSCGCTRYIKRKKDLVGQHFGDWEVLKMLPGRKALCRCVVCGTEKEQYHSNLTRTGYKFKCNHVVVDCGSTVENEIASYIQDDLKLEIVRSYNEIDIYISSLKTGIEYNGNFWHNSKNKPKNYHKDKTFQCEAQGVRLIHIFEYEWENDKDLIKQYLRDTLCNKEVIYARQTELINVNGEIAKNFINKYHLQGYAASEINIGLKYNNEVVGMMTFGRPRFNTDAEYELIRLCFKSGYSVVGGVEKVFKAFVENYKPNSIISYCNIAKFTGKVYNNLGFKINKITEPNYVWCKGRNIKTRYQTQKNRLVKQGLGTPDMTEDQIMQNLGYVKIYDCGNLQCIWKNDNNNERK